MVSFSCEVCNDTVIKKKLDQHTQRCYGAYFTCIDCSITFQGTEYRKHTSCISESEKYEKALYKGPKKNVNNKNNTQQDKNKKKPELEEPKQKPSKEIKKIESKKETPKSFDLSKHVSKKSSDNLYKIVKKIAKENKKDTKDILKNLKITQNQNGEYTLTF